MNRYTYRNPAVPEGERQDGRYAIFDRRRGSRTRDAIATCADGDDARRIVDALNAAEQPPAPGPRRFATSIGGVEA